MIGKENEQFIRGTLTIIAVDQYWIFHHSVIETCFEMLKSSEHKKSLRYSNYEYSNFKDCYKVKCADPPI